jgi:hypothetical protein
VRTLASALVRRCRCRSGGMVSPAGWARLLASTRLRSADELAKRGLFAERVEVGVFFREITETGPPVGSGFRASPRPSAYRCISALWRSWHPARVALGGHALRTLRTQWDAIVGGSSR